LPSYGPRTTDCWISAQGRDNLGNDRPCNATKSRECGTPNPSQSGYVALPSAGFVAIFVDRTRFDCLQMLLLESLPTVICAAAIAPALLMLWLVIAADERPGPPAQVWLAFILGAASISLLGLVRAPFNALLAIPENPWMTLVLRS